MVEESGDGEPLVLVHGSWEDRRTWAPVEEGLGSRFRMVAYDRRGHSDSEGGAPDDTRRDDEDDLAALIEDRGLAPANVVATSFGGSIALGLASRRPELFRSLAVHEPPLIALAADDPTVAEFGGAAVPMVESIQRGDREAGAAGFVEIVLGPGAWDMLPEEDRRTMVENADTFAGEMGDPDFGDLDLESLGGLEAPVLLSQGDQSPPFFAKIVARIAEGVDGAQVRVFEGAGHVPHVSHPEEYIAAIDGFVPAGSAGR